MKCKPLAAFAAGLMLLLVCLGLGLLLVFSLRGLYVSQVEAWDLPAQSGLSREEILLNYNALMDWCSPFYRQALSLPTLPMSPGGAQHFAECKTLFNGLLGAAALSLIGLAVLLSAALRRRAYSVLWGAGAVSLCLPAVLLGACAIDFSRAFVLFHQVFFRNDLWLFDPRTDPVILLLPEAYFLRCAVVLCAVVAVGGLALLLGGLLLARRAKR